jgi:hypothetical protein
MSTRRINTANVTTREELADALQAVFISELLEPSGPLWVVTPWISDVEIIDNRTGRFTGLFPEFPQRWIRLIEVFLFLLERGGAITIACRPIEHNSQFRAKLLKEAKERGFENRVRIETAEELHEKGILTSKVYISGSMNLTYNGLRVLEEQITLDNSPEVVATVKIGYQERWGEPS